MGPLAEEIPRGAVASGEGDAVGGGRHFSGQGAGMRVDRLAEVRGDEVRRGRPAVSGWAAWTRGCSLRCSHATRRPSGRAHWMRAMPASVPYPVSKAALNMVTAM